MSNYSLIAVVLFVVVAAVVMAYCEYVEDEASSKPVSHFGCNVVYMVCFGVIVFLSMSTNANAGQHDPEWNPPSRYDHAYTGQMVVHRVPVGQVDEACISLYTKHDRMAWRWQVKANQHGCSFVQGSVCEVVIPTGPIMKATPIAILRHETGHCNGWSGEHEL